MAPQNAVRARRHLLLLHYYGWRRPKIDWLSLRCSFHHVQFSRCYRSLGTKYGVFTLSWSHARRHRWVLKRFIHRACPDQHHHSFRFSQESGAASSVHGDTSISWLDPRVISLQQCKWSLPFQCQFRRRISIPVSIVFWKWNVISRGCIVLYHGCWTRSWFYWS